jgi:hypothetical protein
MPSLGEVPVGPRFRQTVAGPLIWVGLVVQVLALGTNKRGLEVDAGSVHQCNLCCNCPFAINVEDEGPISTSCLFLGGPLLGLLPGHTACNHWLACAAASLTTRERFWRLMGSILLEGPSFTVFFLPMWPSPLHLWHHHHPRSSKRKG